MSNGIRPAGAGPTAPTTHVENDTTVETPAEPQPQENSSTNASPASNADGMRGDLGLFGQLNEMFLRNALPQAAPDPNAANALRMKTLPAELEKANIPKKVREDLLAQLSGKSGADLKQLLDKTDKALAAKDPAGELKGLVMMGKIDAYKESFNSTYDIGGKKVQATPHFRMTNGASGQRGRTDFASVRADLKNLIQKHDKGKPKDQQLWSPKMHDAIRYVAGGKGSAEQVKRVTDALIKSGEFEKTKAKHPGLSDSDTIRMMQWDHGIGIDCAGYVSQAFVGVHGGNNAKYGLQQVNDENLMGLKGNGNFKQVKPTDIRPGDLIALEPPKRGDVGHTVLVREHHIASQAERNSYVYEGSENFSKIGDKIHVYEVDASWGAGSDGDRKGGVQRRTWLYNENTGKWALTWPEPDGSITVRSSTMNGPYDHPMNGIYRPKGE